MKYDVAEDFERVLVDGFASRAYIVSPASEDECDYAVLVFADNEELACEIGAPAMDGDARGCKARRAPEHDARAALYLAACVEEDPEYMRDAGWHHEHEDSCGSCGLSAFGMEKYGVCRGCNECKVCIETAEEDDDGPCNHEEWGFSCE
jgi:hypothetical protein